MFLLNQLSQLTASLKTVVSLTYNKYYDLCVCNAAPFYKQRQTLKVPFVNSVVFLKTLPRMAL